MSPLEGRLPRDHRGDAARAPNEELRDLAGAVMAKGATEPLGLYVFRADEPGAELSKSVERMVYEEDFGAASESLDEEFAPYEKSMLLVCILDHRLRRPVGTLRLIFPSPVGLKVLNDFEAVWGRPASTLFAQAGFEYEPGRTFNIASLAVAPNYRRAAFQGLVTMSLFQSASQIGLRSEMSWFLATLYVPVLRMLQWKFHRPFSEFTGVEPRSFPDREPGASLPAWGNLHAWHARLRERDQVLHDIMVRGVGLDPVVHLPDWDATADLVRSLTAPPDLRLHLR